MGFINIQNVEIKGIAACVPANVEENKTLPVFKEGEAERVMSQTKIERKRVVKDGMTLADMFVPAFDKLIDELGWEKSSIDLLVVVTDSFEYLVPATACVLHGVLGLSESCHVFDIRQGCPGWIIGLSTMASMLSSGQFKRGILLAGEVTTLMNSPLDKETRPLFGDAATATALEYSPDAPNLLFNHGTRGADFKAIFTPAGGIKNPVTQDSLVYKEYGPNQLRRDIDCSMNGMDVFAFGMSMAPKSVNSLMETYNIDKESIDYFVFHQANGYMNEKIRKKLKIDPAKVPYSLMNFGNTASASIPLTIVTQCNKDYAVSNLKTLACAFGVGLAWGSVCFQTNKIVCPDLIEI